jgi:cell division GTPase FtsZ
VALVKLALIGIGQAGGKVAEALLSYQNRAGGRFVADAIAVNTARADLLGLRLIPPEKRVLIGQSRVKGHGVGADNDLGARIAVEDVGEVLAAVDRIPVHDVDAFLVVAALGGGTGSGAAPVVARELRRLYTEPVYGLGVLPAADEGGIYTLNAARSFRTFVGEVDNLLLFDNDAWRRGEESLLEGYAGINEELARRLGVLFGAGETDGRVVAESVVDASEVINTLAGGGVSTIGYASAAVEKPKRSLFGRNSPGPVDEGAAVTRVLSLVRRAALGRLTLPCEIAGAERALVVVAGPPEQISRRGVERGRKWLEEATGSMEVRGGDYPVPDSGHVAAVVLLSGVYDVPRVKELQRVAIETQRNIEDRGRTAPGALSDLLSTEGLSDDGDALEPLF